jgi:hypothetical protein
LLLANGHEGGVAESAHSLLNEGLHHQLEYFTLLHESICVLILLLLDDQLEHQLLVSICSYQDNIHHTAF